MSVATLANRLDLEPLENIMEVIQLLTASKDGLTALASVTLAITMLVASLGALAYKAQQPSDSGSK